MTEQTAGPPDEKAVPPAETVAVGNIRIQIRHVPECLNLGEMRALVQQILARSGVHATLEEVEGPYPSPSLVINGSEVTNRPIEHGPSCRLDLPTEEGILAALVERGEDEPR